MPVVVAPEAVWTATMPVPGPPCAGLGFTMMRRLPAVGRRNALTVQYQGLSPPWLVGAPQGQWSCSPGPSHYAAIRVTNQALNIIYRKLQAQRHRGSEASQEPSWSGAIRRVRALPATPASRPG